MFILEEDLQNNFYREMLFFWGYSFVRRACFEQQHFCPCHHHFCASSRDWQEGYVSWCSCHGVHYEEQEVQQHWLHHKNISHNCFSNTGSFGLCFSISILDVLLQWQHCQKGKELNLWWIRFLKRLISTFSSSSSPPSLSPLSSPKLFHNVYLILFIRFQHFTKD